MRYLIDSADVETIRKTISFYPVAGVTTNPSIVAKSGKDLKTVLTEVRSVIGPQRMLHVQVLALRAEDMSEEAKRIRDFCGENTYVKIPVTEEGFAAIQKVSAAGIPVTATAIFTPQQALMAAVAGAKFAAPYVNRLDNIASGGVNVAAEAHRLLQMHGMDCEVLAASFKTVEQIHQVIMAGVSCVTIQPEFFAKLTSHPLTDTAVADFVSQGKRYYNL